MAERITGKVRWFNNSLGYGFVQPSSGGADVFVHYSNIEMEGYKTLTQDQVVEFEVGAIDKDGSVRSNAVQVRPLTPSEDPTSHLDIQGDGREDGRRDTNRSSDSR